MVGILGTILVVGVGTAAWGFFEAFALLYSSGNSYRTGSMYGHDQDDMLPPKHRRAKKHHRPQPKPNTKSDLNLAFVGGSLSNFGGLGGKMKRGDTSEAAFEVSWTA